MAYLGRLGEELEQIRDSIRKVQSELSAARVRALCQGTTGAYTVVINGANAIQATERPTQDDIVLGKVCAGPAAQNIAAIKQRAAEIDSVLTEHKNLIDDQRGLQEYVARSPGPMMRDGRAIVKRWLEERAGRGYQPLYFRAV